jgi:hypothetical protein
LAKNREAIYRNKFVQNRRISQKNAEKNFQACKKPHLITANKKKSRIVHAAVDIVFVFSIQL